MYYYHFLTDCPESSLQPQFVTYPGWYISGHNYNVTAGVTVAQCRARCGADPLCRSFEFNHDSVKCYLASLTPLHAPLAWGPASTNLSYYQKTCSTM